MKPVYQQTATDCLSSCIASLLEIKHAPDWTKEEDFWATMQGWLKRRNLFFYEVQLTEKMPWIPLPFPIICVFMGDTEGGIKHAVIGRIDPDGSFNQIFNPLPMNPIQSVTALGFIVPLDPSISLLRTVQRSEKITVDIANACE